MYGVPLGMAAMGALFIDVRGKLVQLNRAGTTTTMDELDSVAPVCRNAFHDGVVSHIIEKRHVLQICARRSGQNRPRIARCLVKPWLHMLKGGLKKVKLAPIPIKNSKFSIHAHAVVPQLMQEQTNGSTSWASRALPGRIGLVVGQGGRGKSAQQHGVNLGAIRPLVKITSIDVVNKGFEMRVFSKIAAQAHHPS